MQKNHKLFNKITKGALSIILASTVAFPATIVFADETTNETAIIDLQAEASTKGENVEAPALLPGDFFYFTKILLEKIQLALTLDDVKEAKLIAEYASERLLEAEALFAEGNEEAALKTMKKAIENIDNANVIVEEQQAENKDDVTVDEESQEEVGEDDGLGEVKEVVSQNIIALTAAMEKVKNPVAKAALQKNIDKSYAKLAKKLEKKRQKKTKELSVEEPATPEIIVEPEVETITPDIETAENTSDVTIPVQPTKKEIQQTAIQEKIEVKKEALQSMKETKASVKEKKAEAKGKHEEKKGNNGNNGKSNK
ncbi:DUF5667 domain-containing protein [Neobacillus niacini]|uniref:DUF5667 domain-containing protein n=1 Tax=Neobacillus niacini TaxID=86668 RepID=UPI003002EFFE